MKITYIKETSIPVEAIIDEAIATPPRPDSRQK